MNKGWVYSGELTADALRSLIRSFSGLTTLSWDLARLDFPTDIEPRQAGCAFSPSLEVRWEPVSEGRFRVLVLSDAELTDLPPELEPVEGDWQHDESTLRLVDLDDKRFAPQFSAYPGGGRSDAKLRCRVFSRNGVVTFVSPREVSYAQES
jgi:hypothetical protein